MHSGQATVPWSQQASRRQVGPCCGATTHPRRSGSCPGGSPCPESAAGSGSKQRVVTVAVCPGVTRPTRPHRPPTSSWASGAATAQGPPPTTQSLHLRLSRGRRWRQGRPATRGLTWSLLGWAGQAPAHPFLTPGFWPHTGDPGTSQVARPRTRSLCTFPEPRRGRPSPPVMLLASLRGAVSPEGDGARLMGTARTSKPGAGLGHCS